MTQKDRTAKIMSQWARAYQIESEILQLLAKPISVEGTLRMEALADECRALRLEVERSQRESGRRES